MFFDGIDLPNHAQAFANKVPFFCAVLSGELPDETSPTSCSAPNPVYRTKHPRFPLFGSCSPIDRQLPAEWIGSVPTGLTSFSVVSLFCSAPYLFCSVFIVSFL